MKFWTKKRAAALGLAALLTLSLAACGEKAPSLEEVEQAASLVQQAVHPDALTIFGATFDETMDDEIRVTVIATGFDKNPADELPKIGTFAKPPVQLEGQEKDEQPKAPFAPIDPIAPAEESPLNRRKIPSMTFSKFSIAGIEWNF